MLDADLVPNDEHRISMISGDGDYFRLVDDRIELLKPLDVPPGILLSEYIIGKDESCLWHPQGKASNIGL